MENKIKTPDDKAQAIKYIISTFPIVNDISEDSLTTAIYKALDIKLYFNSKELIYAVVEKLHPKPENADFTEGSDYRQWWKWFDSISKWADNYYLPLWRSTNGYVRTIEAACELCAEIWLNKLFNVAIQDNGAWNEGESGAAMNVMGSVLKADAMADVPNEVKDKVKEGIRNFYADHKYSRELGCDYNPCVPLYDILVDSGLSKDDALRIGPWKTFIKIMPEDNSIRIYTYQHNEYV